MNLDNVIQLISKKASMASTLGMRFISTPEPDTCEAEMKVDEHSRQPFGYISGGASVALAVAHILHQGHSLHVWQVSLYDGKGTLACVVQVTNFLMPFPHQ